MSNSFPHNPEIRDLYNKYITNEISEAEFHQLLDGFSQPDKELLLTQFMTDTWKATEALPVFMFDEPLRTLPISPRTIFFKRTVLKISAAALIILSLGVLGIWQLKKSGQGSIVAKKNSEQQDIQPAPDRTTLTLADGTVITLDSASNGLIANQGDTKVIKLGIGQLSYQDLENAPNPTDTLYNTITTSKGGRYQIVLPDGSNVWLNAASTLKFPATFPAGKREVELYGEGYFEIANEAERPFSVTANFVKHQVLGTRFNIRSYLEEDLSITTLVDGKLLLKNANNSKVLKAKEYGVISHKHDVKNNALLGPFQASDPFIEAALGWKDGMFIFNKTNIRTIMGDISRWYDVEVIYKGDMHLDHFTGKISRKTSLAKALKLLEMTNTLHFKLVGKTIEVSH